MAKYLVKQIETFRVDNEEEAKSFIEEQKRSREYSLTRYSNEYKERKAKGEVIDSWYRVTLTKTFNDEKEPISAFYSTDLGGNSYVNGKEIKDED